MNDYEPLGYLASALVLATFWTRSMLPLRLTAIASNVAFISWGLLTGTHPVLLLHLLLLPMNLLRVAQCRSAAREDRQRPGCQPTAGPRHAGGRALRRRVVRRWLIRSAMPATLVRLVPDRNPSGRNVARAALAHEHPATLAHPLSQRRK